MTELTCKGCGETKPVSEFYRQKKNKSGYTGKCKVCVNEQVAAWRGRNPDLVYTYRKAWEERNPERKHALRQRSHRQMDPVKKAARKKVANQVYEGRIHKPLVCERCGFKAEKLREIHAHHEDYTKPLEVEWLCADCHERTHRPNEAPAPKRVPLKKEKK